MLAWKVFIMKKIVRLLIQDIKHISKFSEMVRRNIWARDDGRSSDGDKKNSDGDKKNSNGDKENSNGDQRIWMVREDVNGIVTRIFRMVTRRIRMVTRRIRMVTRRFRSDRNISGYGKKSSNRQGQISEYKRAPLLKIQKPRDQ